MNAADSSATFRPTRRGRPLGLLALLGVVSVVLAVSVGSVALSPMELWLTLTGQGSPLHQTLVWELRLPRALAAFGTGALLALAGALMQVLLRNPLADPYVLGLSGGASVAALCAMLAGLGAALNTGQVTRGDSVAVIGCGGVGNAAIAGAKLGGAHTIIGVDIDDRKLEWAKDFGATHTVNATRDDPVDAVGTPQTYEQAFFARDLAGTVVLVGVPGPEMKIELPMLEIFGRGGVLKSSWYGDCLPSRDFPVFIELYLQGRLDLDRFVSETISIDDVEQGFQKMERGEVLRSVVLF